MKVLKFGGGCLKDAKSIKKLPKVLEEYRNSPIIIILSAFGKITNMLENSDFKSAINFLSSIMEGLDFTEEEKNDILKTPLSPTFLGDNFKLWSFSDFVFSPLEKSKKTSFIKNYFNYPMRVCIGEYISSSIIHYYLLKSSLNNILLDAALCLKTSSWNDEVKSSLLHSAHFPKKINPYYKELFSVRKWSNDCVYSKNSIVITQGFISSSLNIDTCQNLKKILPANQRTTLGREGSDYSAAIFSRLYNADEIILFKDVDGVYNLDPKKNANARIFLKLNYDQAFDLFSKGNTVVHPKTINYIKKYSIPLLVKNFNHPDRPGTIIN